MDFFVPAGGGILIPVTLRFIASPRPFLRWLFLALLAVPASQAAGRTLWNLHLWQRLRTEAREAPQGALDRYLRRLEPALPASGRIGLVQTGSPSPADATRTHYLLQYALAPRLIVPDACCEFLIEYGPAAPSPAQMDRAYALVASAGPDLRLFRRMPR